MVKRASEVTNVLRSIATSSSDVSHTALQGRAGKGDGREGSGGQTGRVGR